MQSSVAVQTVTLGTGHEVQVGLSRVTAEIVPMIAND
jgi:hypothetical protein